VGTFVIVHLGDPASALDPTPAYAVMDLMEQLADKDITIVAVTLETRVTWCETGHITLMANGRMSRDGTSRRVVHLRAEGTHAAVA
jgi:ABC-type cobalamin/Fe3+-siderophores transport system ATPase subunit